MLKQQRLTLSALLVLATIGLVSCTGIKLEEVEAFKRINAYLKEKLPDNDFQSPSTVAEDMKKHFDVLKEWRLKETMKIKIPNQKPNGEIVKGCTSFMAIVKLSGDDYCDSYAENELKDLNSRCAFDYQSMDRLKKIIDIQEKARQVTCNVPPLKFDDNPQKDLPNFKLDAQRLAEDARERLFKFNR